MKDNKLKVVDENNNEVEVTIIDIFKLDSSDEKYVLYTDNTQDENQKIFIRAAIIEENEEEVLFKSITDEKVVKKITEKLKEMLQD